MTDWILGLLKESGAIKNGNETVVKYGLQKAVSFLTDLLITIVCAALFGIVLEGLIFWFTLFIQRMYMGGYHAKSQRNCLFISWIVTIISFFVIKTDTNDSVLLYTMGLSCILIWIKAPVEANNKPLSHQEIMVYQKVGRWMAGICFFITLLLRVINFKMIFKPLALATIMTGLGIIAAMAFKCKEVSDSGK